MSAEDTLEALGSLEASPQALSQEELWDVVARIATVNHELIITGEALASLPPTEWLWEPYIPWGISPMCSETLACVRADFAYMLPKGYPRAESGPMAPRLRSGQKPFD